MPGSSTQLGGFDPAEGRDFHGRWKPTDATSFEVWSYVGNLTGNVLIVLWRH